ncbi:MAG: hypothetical protein NUV56_02490, partial [Candidatus Uhrbacteria bacterium]|nr:hypothetical protein [Candidatus Uhrbacteria bacterium]
PTDDELRAWPMPEVKVEIPGGTMPDVSPIPLVVENFDGSIDVYNRVGYLIAGSLIPEVSGRFFKHFENHEILLIPQTRSGNYAAFGLEPGTALELPPARPKDALYPVFSYSTEKIAAIETPRQALEAMLIVYHESRHAEQWFAATDPNEKASFGAVEFERVPVEVCGYIYENELEAYHDMCQQAYAWDMPDFWQCVPFVDAALFRHVVFIMMRDGQGRNVPECVSTWAKDAGHPKPSVYDVP